MCEVIVTISSVSALISAIALFVVALRVHTQEKEIRLLRQELGLRENDLERTRAILRLR